MPPGTGGKVGDLKQQIRDAEARLSQLQRQIQCVVDSPDNEYGPDRGCCACYCDCLATANASIDKAIGQAVR